MFRKLSKVEEKEFRQWARENSEKEVSPLYHPVVNDELRKIQDSGK